MIEYANRLGEPLPNNLKLVDPLAENCCVGSDLYLLGKLLNEPSFIGFKQTFEKLRELLSSEERFKVKSVSSLKNNPWLASYWK